MQYIDLISSIYRFVDANTDISARFLGVESQKIQKNVVISPGWGPERMPGLGNPELIASGALYGSLNVWNINNGNAEITYIQTGCGAAILMDALLALGVSDCENIIFVSSVGAVDANISIGDVVIPEYSITGDGASRYIASNNLDKVSFALCRRSLAECVNLFIPEETESPADSTISLTFFSALFCLSDNASIVTPKIITARPINSVTDLKSKNDVA